MAFEEKLEQYARQSVSLWLLEGETRFDDATIGRMMRDSIPENVNLSSDDWARVYVSVRVTCGTIGRNLKIPKKRVLSDV